MGKQITADEVRSGRFEFSSELARRMVLTLLEGCEAKGVTLTELCEATGIQRSSIWNLVTGRSSGKLDTWDALYSALGVDVGFRVTDRMPRVGRTAENGAVRARIGPVAVGEVVRGGVVRCRAASLVRALTVEGQTPRDHEMVTSLRMNRDLVIWCACQSGVPAEHPIGKRRDWDELGRCDVREGTSRARAIFEDHVRACVANVAASK